MTSGVGLFIAFNLIVASQHLPALHTNPPCLQGQDLYNSKQVRDKQIVRILGKVSIILIFDFCC